MSEINEDGFTLLVDSSPQRSPKKNKKNKKKKKNQQNQNIEQNHVESNSEPNNESADETGVSNANSLRYSKNLDDQAESNDEFLSVNSSTIEVNEIDSEKDIEILDPDQTETIDAANITVIKHASVHPQDEVEGEDKSVIDLTHDVEEFDVGNDKGLENHSILHDQSPVRIENESLKEADSVNLNEVVGTDVYHGAQSDFNEDANLEFVKGVSDLNDLSLSNNQEEIKKGLDELIEDEEKLDEVEKEIANDYKSSESVLLPEVENAHTPKRPEEEEVEDKSQEEEEIDQFNLQSQISKDKIKEKLNEVISSNINTAVSPPLPSRRSINSWFKLNTAPIELEDEVYNYTSPTDNQLFISQLNQITKEFQSKNEKDQEQIKTGTKTLRNTFNEIKLTIENLGDLFGYKIDWDFWTKVVNDYQSVVINDNVKLNQAINNGIPKEFRGMIWQLISNSKNFQLEELYALIKSEDSLFEKSIKRDLSRTSFISNNDMIDKLDSLYNVIKAYSIFDPEVGYTQGMAFIAVPLLMNMSESESFCLLVNLMKNYNLRSLFLTEMKGLHLLLYQFDRLLEDNSPRLYNHLVKQGIKSSMYASQWFLTFFAYKFPLDIVLRIYDIIITQGIESILKFAINLMIKNEYNLINLKFDQLLEFLKDKLFNYYLNDEVTTSNTSNSKRFSFISKKSTSSNNNFKLDSLVLDSMNIPLLPVNLKKYELEFEKIYSSEKSKESEIELIKVNNGKLRNQIKSLEVDFTNLNRENFKVTNEMIDKKMEIANLEDENKELENEILELTSKLKDLESKIMSSNGESGQESQLPENIELEIQKTMDKNLQVMESNRMLEEELTNYEMELKEVSSKLEVFEKNKKINWFKW